jgi:hypothetical protein
MTITYYTIEDVEVTKGDDWVPVYTYLDGDGIAVDITGYTFRLSIKESKNSSTPIIGPITGTIVNAAQGKFSFAVTSTQTNTLLERVYVYDIQVIDNNGVITTRRKGSLTIGYQVTP